MGYVVTHTGRVLLRCFIVPAHLLVLLVLCAHDKGIRSGPYQLGKNFQVFRSILFSLEAWKTAAAHRRAPQHVVWMPGCQVCETGSFSSGGNISPSLIWLMSPLTSVT